MTVAQSTTTAAQSTETIEIVLKSRVTENYRRCTKKGG